MSSAGQPDWDQSTVGEQFDVQLGKMLDAARNVGEPKRYLGNRAVRWGAIDVSAAGTVPMTQKDLSRYRLRGGDLVVCEGGEVGRAAIWRNELPECYYQKALHRLRPKYGYEVRLMLAFLEYWTSVGGFANYVTQTSIAHLPRDKFVQMHLPLPHASEQECLGDVVDDLNAQIATLERLIAKKRAIKQGMMQQLLTGRRRLPSFSAPWGRSMVRSIVSTPVTDGPHSTPRFLANGVPFLSVNNLIDGKIDWSDLRFISREDHDRFSKKCRPGRGDVLLGKAASVGKVAYLDTDREVNIWSPIALIRTNSLCIPKFAYYQLQSPGSARQIELLTNASSQGNIGMGDIEKIQLELPAAGEQAAIVQVLEDIDASLEALKAQLVKAQAIKQGMMQQLLTGRTRLPFPESEA